MKKTDMTITIKALCLFEALSGKSFFQMEGADIMYLVYAVLVTNNPDYRIPFSTFSSMASNQKVMARLFKSVQEELTMMQEVSEIVGGNQKKETVSGEKEDKIDTEPQKVTDIADYLIVGQRMDPHYVMYEMGLWELQGLFKAVETEEKTQMEDKRLWSYINIMPHIDSKKVKSPEKLLPFSWEKESREQKLKNEFEDMSGKMAEFFKSQQKKEEDNG